MQIYVQGFGFAKKSLPKAMRAVQVFELMGANSGASWGQHYQYGASKYKVTGVSGSREYWAGMVLRIRDAKAFTKIKTVNGKKILTAEDLGEDKLAEFNFFIADPDSGAGLYTHHYHSTGLMRFGRLCYILFNKELRNARNHALAKCGDDPEKVKKNFVGSLVIEQLSDTADLVQLVKRLARVNAYEFRLKNITFESRLFRGIAARADTAVVKYAFPPDQVVSDLADELDPLLNEADIDDIRAFGIDSKGTATRYELNGNPLAFGVMDYDQVMKGLKLDLNDWENLIQKSGIVAYLASIVASPRVSKMLKEA